MRRRTSRWGVALSALTIAAVPVFAAAPALADETQAPPPSASSIDWKPCEQAPKVECGTVAVPVDWSKPNGKTIDMAVARRKATNPDKRIGSLIFMPGGPGGSGVSSLISGLPFSKEISSKFDLVSFDPRGIGRSNPVECDTKLVQNPPPAIPNGNDKQFQQLREYNRKLSDSCRKNAGALLDNMDSVNTARDLDALREALGAEKINLYGISYGTLAGQMYAENFPERLRALVLDSTMDHSLNTRDFLTTEAAAAEDSFNEFVTWCEATKSCALHGEDVVKVFDKLYERAERGELHLPGKPEMPLPPENLSGLVVNGGYGPSWAALATQLDQLRKQQPSPAAAVSAKTPYSGAAFCADYRVKIASADQYKKEWQEHSKAAPHLRYSLGWPNATRCVDWGAKVGNPQHRLEIKNTGPILVLNSQHDPATPYTWAKGVDRQVDAATLLTYDGWGHGVYDRSECTMNAADRYFVDLKVPAEGTHCSAVPPGQGSAMTEHVDLTGPLSFGPLSFGRN